MSEKREADLINLRIIKKTEKIFPDEIIVLRATTNFMRRLTKISSMAIATFDKQQNLRAIMELFCRNRELTHFSIVCMVNGGYSETKVLSRVATENFLLMRLFAIQPDIANVWFSNPEQFRKKWTPNVIRKTVFSDIPERAKSYETFYWLLCDYTHPSFKGWYEIFKEKNGGVFIGACPEFNPNYASECIGLICFVSLQTIRAYAEVFEEWLDNNLLIETNKLMPKLYEIMTRHFEVRTYDKKKLLVKKS